MMLGHQFQATIAARLAGNKEANFMPYEEALKSFDDVEDQFRMLAEKTNGKP